jgi:hypothetical protein
MGYGNITDALIATSDRPIDSKEQDEASYI